MKRQIDILFTTHNGQRTLPRMLQALAELEVPERPWRILAVNNASRDGTADILESWTKTLPLRVHYCGEPGKSQAQRSALPHLGGDLVVLTDDDIIPAPGWLRALEAAADRHPEVRIFGGAITPSPIEEVGPWYLAAATYHSDLFALTTAAGGPVQGADTIFGPNMMLRHAEAVSALKQDRVLGPTFANPGRKRVFPLGDESEMIAQLERAGATALFVPEARVEHMVRAFQTDLGFMLQRAQNHGRGVVLRALKGRSDWTGRLRYALAGAFRAAILWLQVGLADRSKPGSATFDKLYGKSWHAGRAKGALFGPFLL